ncbi:hypothetical protein [Desulfarculus baarsii]|nr:hypothetical protein [Desulfarculus baarsii]
MISRLSARMDSGWFAGVATPLAAPPTRIIYFAVMGAARAIVFLARA